jgi:hypothetical protein
VTTPEFKQGEEYWLAFSDGSMVLVAAHIDKHGEVDLRNDLMDFSLWAGGSNLRGIDVESAS